MCNGTLAGLQQKNKKRKEKDGFSLDPCTLQGCWCENHYVLVKLAANVVCLLVHTHTKVNEGGGGGAKTDTPAGKSQIAIFPSEK